MVSAVHVTVSNILSVWFSADGTINSIVGSAVAKDPSEPAKLLVSFFESENPLFYYKHKPSRKLNFQYNIVDIN